MSQANPVPQVPAADVPADAFLLDVREHDEWDAGHVPGALHIPLGALAARHTEIQRDQPVFVICRTGARSDYAAQALVRAGWDARNVADGMMGWQAGHRPMTSESGDPYVA
jgi:rhodanese-related sulfurtransferase